MRASAAQRVTRHAPANVGARKAAKRLSDAPTAPLGAVYIEFSARKNKGHVLVDEADVPLIAAHRWYALPQKHTTYAITEKSVLMHRVILGLGPDDKRVVDHIDGNGLNNRRSNLRVCTHAENIRWGVEARKALRRSHSEHPRIPCSLCGQHVTHDQAAEVVRRDGEWGVVHVRCRVEPVAVLFADPRGIYANLPGVDLWDKRRDARLYAGPHPVVAHPPCNLWVNFAALNFARYGGEHNRPGNDGGCFASALANVRCFGGVLEHPAESRAWAAHGLTTPQRDGGWHKSLFASEWVCEVWQSAYGHPARKRTWLFYVGARPPELRWDRPAGSHQVGWQFVGPACRGEGARKKPLSKRAASATPPPSSATRCSRSPGRHAARRSGQGWRSRWLLKDGSTASRPRRGPRRNQHEPPTSRSLENDTMSNETKIGWISSARFGYCGYQESFLGLLVHFSGHGWGCAYDVGFWAWSKVKHSQHCKWTPESRDNQILEACRRLDQVLTEAGKEHVGELNGTPVECVFVDGRLDSWRVLTEVIANAKKVTA